MIPQQGDNPRANRHSRALHVSQVRVQAGCNCLHATVSGFLFESSETRGLNRESFNAGEIERIGRLASR